MLRIGVYIVEKVILKLTVKTKTNLDDLIIEKSSKPLTLIVFLIGVKIAIDKLPWADAAIKTSNTILNTLMAIIALYLIYVIFNLSFSRVIKKVARKTKSTHNEGLLQLTKSTLKVILVLAGIIYILRIWGIEIGPLLTGIGIGGIAIAFALQSSLGNVFGGVSIILDKSINVGDLVNLSDGTTGKIERIGIRSTRVKTFDNEIVIVPNSKLADSNIKNIAQPEPKSRVVIPFGVAYGSDIEKVKKIVMKEIKSVENFTEEPEPAVKFLEMGDSSLNFKAFFFVNSYEQRFNAIDEANTKIYNALNKNKIEIPFPQMDVHLKKK
jgi:MscS family membrane protein